MNLKTYLSFAAVVLVCHPAEMPAADFVVNNTSDSGAGSFRTTVALANFSTAATVRIVFDAAVFPSTTTIISAAGPYIITKAMTIVPPPGGVTFRGNPGKGVFEITGTAAGQTTFTKATFQQGFGIDGGLVKVDATGSTGTVSVAFNECTFSDATATGRGGGCFVGGGAVASFNRCRFDACDAHDNGGGAAIVGSTASFRTCLFIDNVSMESGGGLSAVNSSVSLYGCSLVQNTAGSGKYAAATNDAVGDGGGIRSGGSATVTLVNTLVADNQDPTLVADPLSDVHPDLSGAFVSSGHNFIGKRDGATGYGSLFAAPPGAGDIVGTIANPLEPYLDGSQRPLWRSPLRDAGDNNAATGFDLDADGTERITNGTVDIGALEMHWSYIVTTNADSGPGSLREAMNGPNTATAITFDSAFFDRPRTITLQSKLPPVLAGMVLDASMAAGVTIDAGMQFPVLSFETYPNVEYHALHSVHLTRGVSTPATSAAGPGVDQPDSRDTLEMFNCAVSQCNTTRSAVGAVHVAGTCKLVNCTISGNTAPNSTGGSAVTGPAVLIHCTVTGNTTASGSPLAVSAAGNCLISNNPAGNGASYTLRGSIGGNLSDVPFFSPQSSDAVGPARIDPVLRGNGGRVVTHALQMDSPAIDHGLATLGLYALPGRDAAGRARSIGERPDAGAWEWDTINYAAWKPLVFAALSDTTEQAPRRDPDGDGVPNAVEFYCGTDPLRANQNPLTITGTAGAITLQFPRAPGRAVQTAGLVSSTDLTAWSALPPAFAAPGVVSTSGFRDLLQTSGSPTAVKQFYRLEVNP